MPISLSNITSGGITSLPKSLQLVTNLPRSSKNKP